MSVHTTNNDNISEEGDDLNLPTALLFKFIKPFSGERSELNTFIQNTNSAFQLASPQQTPTLFLYVVSQLSTEVINELELSDIESWHDLKIVLKQFYGQTKHLVQIHEELETIKQYFSESITDFFKRLEKIKNECIQAEILNTYSDREIPGLKKAIQQTALRRFIIHCKPEISQMLRARNISDLNEAYSIALQEEKLINYTKSKIIPKNNNFQRGTHSNQRNFNQRNFNQNNFFRHKYNQGNTNPNNSRNNNMSNSRNFSSNYRPNYVNQNHPHPSTSNTPSKNQNLNPNASSFKFCNYCKKPGHLINDCFKRNQNNSKINHLNLKMSDLTNAQETD